MFYGLIIVLIVNSPFADMMIGIITVTAFNGVHLCNLGIGKDMGIVITFESQLRWSGKAKDIPAIFLYDNKWVFDFIEV